MLDIMPLHLFCRQEGLAAHARLDDLLRLDWPGTSDRKTHAISHLKYWQMTMRELGLNFANSDRCTQTKWSLGFRINRDSFTGEAKHRKLSQYNVYTDGSRSEGQTGAGLVIYKGKNEISAKSYRLPDSATVFQGEITAIKQAAAELCKMELPIKYVKFFVDSQAAILALANPITRSKTVASAIDALNRLMARATAVTISWIPAHRGHFGNEKADRLAKLGTITTEPSKTITTPRPHVQIKNDIRSGIQKTWTTEWTNNPMAKHTKEFYATPCPQKATFVYKLARLELGRFVRLITGHNNLNHFQTRIGLWGSSLCRLCHEADETFVHFLHECPRLRQRRVDIFRDEIPQADMAWSVRDLLDFSYTPTVNDAFEGSWAHGDPVGLDNMDTASEDNTASEDDPITPHTDGVSSR